MDDFSVFGTAFGGYRMLAARPATVVWWFGLALLLTLIQVAATVELAGPQLAALQTLQTAAQKTPAVAGAATQGLASMELFSLLFPWLTGVILLGAATRAVLRPEESAYGYLRFGGDELRLLVVTLVLAVLFFIGLIVFTMIAAIGLGVFAGDLFKDLGADGGAEPPRRLIGLVVLAMAPGLVILLLLAVKLALAPAQSVADRAIQIFGSWSLTRGCFWKMLAVFLIALIPAAAMYALSLAIMLLGGHGGVLARLQGMGATSFAVAFDGRHVANYVVGAVARVVNMAAILMPAAIIYRALTPADADVFGDD